MRLLDVPQMSDVDARARARIGDTALMRLAGVALARAIERLAPQARCLVAFAGPGNNGGDAFAAFAELDPSQDRVIFAMPASAASEGRRDAEIRARVAGVRVVEHLPATPEAARDELARADLVLDGLLGIGARPAPSEAMRAAIAGMNGASTYVLAIDVPTGVDAATGAVSEHAVRADATVTIGAVKLGLTLDPARANVGALYLAEIGLGEERDAADSPLFAMLTERDFARLLPARVATADKRTAGAPLIIAGSGRYPGAGILCARGAARAGAGYVTVATSEAAGPAMREHLVEQVVVTYDLADVAGTVDAIDDLVARGGAVAIGPGLGMDAETGEIVRRLIERLEVPFVADASAFGHLSANLEILRGKRCVLTPHESEFARLSGAGKIVPHERLARLREFVERTGATTLLKGRATLIDDGRTLHVNPTGTSALATAGTGDVLTGIIATLLAQGLSPVDAARAGAYWHGLAGQAAARERPVGVVAGDLPEHLARALPQPVAREPGDPLERVF